MKQPELQGDILRFLGDAASARDCDINSLLRDCLSIRSVWDDARFLPYLKDKKDEIGKLLNELDQGLRVRNPGLHHVFRKEFIGYRREGKELDGPYGERSHIFASVRVLQTGILVVLPVDPDLYEQYVTVRNLSGTGHHGIGNLQYNIANEHQLDEFFSLFDNWLRPR